MGRRRDSDSMASNTVFGWVQKQSMKVQVALAVSIMIATTIVLHYFLNDGDFFYIFCEVSHTIANLILVYKLTKHKSCSGLSLRTQELTAVFVASRLMCVVMDNFGMELHVVLDFITLIATGWVIYMMRFKLQSTYAKDLDNIPIHYLLFPCFILSLIANPGGFDYSGMTLVVLVFYAFSTYVKAVSILPQLCLIQNSKIVEPFTAHYVFALGLSRFFGFGHWVLVIYESGGKSLLMLGTSWFYWFVMQMVAEIVQTFILADFCYYYVKSVIRGQQITLTVPV